MPYYSPILRTPPDGRFVGEGRSHGRGRGRGHGRGRTRGFTLIEAATTTVIIGVGCLAMLQLLAAGTRANGESGELTTAMNLAGNIRECLTHHNGPMQTVAFSDVDDTDNWGPEAGETTVNSYDDLDDFDGMTFSPPIDARRASMGTPYNGWSQSIVVESINPDDLKSVIPHLTHPPGLRPVSRITVTVKRYDKTVYTQSWFASYAPAN
jgi:type II secretory pathway pseudopilin PulG